MASIIDSNVTSSQDKSKSTSPAGADKKISSGASISSSGYNTLNQPQSAAIAKSGSAQSSASKSPFPGIKDAISQAKTSGTKVGAAIQDAKAAASTSPTEAPVEQVAYTPPVIGSQGTSTSGDGSSATNLTATTDTTKPPATQVSAPQTTTSTIDYSTMDPYAEAYVKELLAGGMTEAEVNNMLQNAGYFG